MTDPALARILVSNDDGINAPGLELLERIARELSPEVWVVAPEQERSGAAHHSPTTRRPLHLTEIGARRSPGRPATRLSPPVSSSAAARSEP